MPQPDSDDHFSLGELVLIEGQNFGRRPVVRIGGQGVKVLARTGAGGVVCRIPTGIESGTIEIVVSHEAGRDATSVGVERYAALLDRVSGQVSFVALGRGSEGDVRSRFTIPGAFDVRMSPDGRAAYVAANPSEAAQTASLHVISLTAGGGPKEARVLHLDSAQVSAFGVAERAPLAAIAGRGKLLLLDLKNALRPRLLAPFPLVGEVHALAVHPGGEQIALLSPRDNLLIPVNVVDRNLPRMDRPVDLWPGEREPMAIDVEFAPGGGEVLVLLGDGSSVPAEDARPTRLASVSWETGEPRLVGAVEIAEASGLPVGLAVGRRARSATRYAPILVTTVNRKLFAGEGVAPSRVEDLAQMLLVEPDGKSRVVSSQTAVFGDPDVSQDLGWALSPTVRLFRGAGGTKLELGLGFDPLRRRGRYRFIKLGEGQPSALKRPPAFAIAP